MTVKVLVSGDVGGKWDVLIARLHALQNSSAGPFHVLFVIGRAFSNESEFKSLHDSIKLPLPTYLFDDTGIPASMPLPENLHMISSGNEGVGLATINNLTVAFCKTNVFNYSKDLATANSIARSPAYRGCDIFLSSEWPSDVHQFLDSELLISSNVSFGPSSPDVASLAMNLRPRYHFAVGKDHYFQRPPYMNKSVGNRAPCSRFIALAAVGESKDKDKKWLHALSLQPITHMSDQEVAEVPLGSTECPYMPLGPVGSKRSLSSPQDRDSSQGKLARGASEQSVSRNSRFDSLDISPPAQGAFFFGQMGVERKAGAGALPTAANIVTKPPSDTIKTLFIGGLGRDTTESELMRCLTGAVRVSRPEGKFFAFVDFSSHEAAKAVMQSSLKQSLTVGKRSLTVGWGKEPAAPSTRPKTSEASIKVDLEPPSEDATTLFLGGLPPAFLQEELLALFPASAHKGLRPVLGKGFCFLDMRDHESAREAVQRAQGSSGPTLRGYKLLVGWAKGDNTMPALDDAGEHSTRAAQFVVQTEPPSAEANTLFVGNLTASISAEDIQSLLRDAVVHRPAGKSYAFVEFASHASAAAGLSALEKALVKGVTLRVGWAKGRSVGRDSHTDECWFCLGSSTVKTHLILSVGESCYLAAPRGAISPDHALVIPIDCVPNRLLLSVEAKKELSRFESAFRSFLESSGRGYLLFERTLRTRGRDHMQVHLVPLDEASAGRSLDSFLQVSSRHNALFTEIPDDRDLDDALLSPDGSPYQEYFFIQLPVRDGTRQNRKFLYVPAPDTADAPAQAKFPLSFGLEVAAEALGRPERANWKACLVGEAEEERAADSFKAKFAGFDFTL